MTSNKHCFFPSGWGARPQAHTGLRQIVAASMCHIDRQIVAWAVTQGHRHRPVDNLKYFSRCHISNTLLWDLLGCQINNNGGDYGINIRLQNSEHGRMDRGPGKKLERVLLSYDDNWNDRNFGRDNRRDLFTFQNKGEIRNFFFCKQNRSKIILDHAAELQGSQDKCEVRKTTCLDQPNGQNHCPGSSVRRYGRRGHNQIVSTSNPGEKSPGFFYAWIMDNRKKEQATSNMRQGTG